MSNIAVTDYGICWAAAIFGFALVICAAFVYLGWKRAVDHQCEIEYVRLHIQEKEVDVARRRVTLDEEWDAEKHGGMGLDFDDEPYDDRN